MPRWSTEQIISLAPDRETLRKARLVRTDKWFGLGHNERAAWGWCLGNRRQPFAVRFDSAGPKFSCECPSNKQPCKHGLSLALLAATAQVPAAAPPVSIASWLAETVDVEPPRKTALVDDEAARRKRDAAAKRAAARERKVAAGVRELRERLRDVVRRGLATMSEHSYAYWDEVAARMVDAQATGLARMVRALGGLPFAGDGWHARAVDRIGRMQLLLSAYERIDDLDEDQRADVRSMIGFRVNKQALLSAAGVRAHWWVLGHAIEEGDMLSTRRTWLWSGGQSALLLDFAAPGTPFGLGLIAGSCIDAELSFYPGTVQRRALIKVQHGVVEGARPSAAFGSIDDAYRAMAAQLSRFPWADRMAVGLRAVTPIGDALCDESDHVVALPRAFADRYKLVALSGGRPLDVFGEWRQGVVVPMTAFVRDTVFPLQASEL